MSRKTCYEISTFANLSWLLSNLPEIWIVIWKEFHFKPTRMPQFTYFFLNLASNFVVCANTQFSTVKIYTRTRTERAGCTVQVYRNWVSSVLLQVYRNWVSSVLCRCTGTRSPRCSVWRWDPTWTLPSSPSAPPPSTYSSSGSTSRRIFFAL
jgi:hypothetical protein